MFQSPPTAYIYCEEENARKSLVVWSKLCERTNLSIVKSALLPIQETVEEHFDTRAALVLEEARETMSQALTELWNAEKRKCYQSFEDLLFVEITDENTPRGFKAYTLKRRATDLDKKKNRFSLEELHFLRPGAVCLLQECGSDVISFAMVKSAAKERLSDEKSFDVLGLNLPDAQEDGWRSPFGYCSGEGMKLIPVEGTFVGLSRQFHALTSCARSVPFVEALLGRKPNGSVPSTACNMPTQDGALPHLNASQARVADTFLSSAPGSVTIVQGPPGTGKSTLLVSILLRYVRNLQDGRQRIMVCAPTNKAVSIVAHRFMREITEREGTDINIIVTGDRDKLRDGGMPDVLKPYVLETWQDTMVSSWEHIACCLEDTMRQGTALNAVDLSSLCEKAMKLRTKLANSLPGLPAELKDLPASICNLLSKLRSDSRESFETITKKILKFIQAFRRLSPLTLGNELMRTAAVVFCTLCRSGSTSVIFTNAFDDLIIDEAAAATEPALYTPFQLLPKRLLVVGDPKQLPAVVLSDRAKRLGLDVSMHDRLMYRCKYDFIMLNCQYRMHPEIASFPSNRFYGDTIENGSNVSHQAYGTNSRRLRHPPYVFYQVHCLPSVAGNLISNQAEADAIVDLVRAMSSHSTGDDDWQSVDRVRVITFYKEQVRLIRRKLHSRGFTKISVDTVDSSQGCEADVVLISFVRGLDIAGFLVDDRRINVALTRARHQLVCVGNCAAMAVLRGAKTETLRLLSHNATSRGAVAILERDR